MNWSSLLPSTWNPAEALRLLFDANSNTATHGLRDSVIFLTFGIAIFFAGIVLWQTLASWFNTRPYLSLTRGGEQAAGGVIASDLPFFREFRHHLIDIPSRDGKGMMSKRRTVDAAEVFRESALGPAFSSSRLVLAIPSILTGLGVLGTFVGLQLGIGSLDLKNPGNLDKSIVPLIEGCAVAFSSSVWGVLASLLFSGWEKVWEGFALGRVRKIQIRVDALFPRYVPEDAMAEIQRTSSGADESLKSLAVAIGAEMQKAIGRLGAEIKDAVSNATAEGHGPLMEKSAELLSSALTAELVKLKEQIGSMADQFSERFNGASDGLVNSVQGFQPTVEALSAVVGDAQRAVTDAVAKLNAHEGVMVEMAGAAENIRVAADTFGTVSETLTISAGRNEEASQAQLLAAQSNERVAEQFARIGDDLPELRQALEDAARVIGSLDSKLEEQIGGMADQFSDKFNGASAGLMKSVQGFQPAVEALSVTMGDAQRTVADAVAKLNAHEGVMQEMAGAALNIRQAAETFAGMNETLAISATRNDEASKAQLSAAQSNERVAEHFGRIGEGLPEMRQTLEDAARVIGSLGSPIAELQTLLQGQPELQRQLDNARSTSESERSQMLLSMSGDLAEKVGRAAQQFAEVGALADKLTASAASLDGASSGLAVFGQQVLQASKEQRDASEASRAAAASGERAAKAFEPLPGAITALTSGLESAGASVRTGAETARDSYRELIVLQKHWFAGAELGLNGMKDRLQNLLKAYGDQVEGQTRNLMTQWTEEVAQCLRSYSAQVDQLQGGLDELQSAISKLRQ